MVLKPECGSLNRGSKLESLEITLLSEKREWCPSHIEIQYVTLLGLGK
jgi:hypothetical protein